MICILSRWLLYSYTTNMNNRVLIIFRLFGTLVTAIQSANKASAIIIVYSQFLDSDSYIDLKGSCSTFKFCVGK